jgi:two-component system nitrate/nitrite response regulator NarL
MTNSRLIIVGKNCLFRAGLRRILTNDKIVVTDEVDSLSETLPLMRSADEPRDLIVYDQPENAALDFDILKEINREFPWIRVVILADNIDHAGFAIAVESGARALLPKNISASALSLSLQLVLSAENLLAAPASLSGSPPPSPEMSSGKEADRPRSSLSGRELQILNCLETGAPNKVIARELDLAEATVKVHIKSVLRKINVGNRTQAAIWALNQRQSSKHDIRHFEAI